MERERELRHFLHYEHPLIFSEELDKDRRGRICSGCRKQMWGPNYSCKECIYSRKECIWFNLHKSCAELPRELEHPLHPKHPLLLICKYFSEIKCGGCNREEHQRGLIYSCSHCNFNLQSKCASLPLTVQAEIHHQHPLTLVRKSLSFTCDACGEEGKGMFYLCAICPFLVHLECSSCPLLVKHIRHTHPLHLTNSLQQPQLNHSDHRLCLLCVKKVKTNYMVYYCSTCDFVTHLHCGANELLWDEIFVPESKDTEPTESTSTLKCEEPYVVRKSKLGEDKVEIPVEIKHFSHEHDLKLIEEQLENNERCDGCMWPIYPPFYTCTPCRIFIHKSCVELPTKKSHPLHRHPLILLPDAPYVGKLFNCDACRRHCNGFVYHCDKCNFDLDVQCSLIPDIFNHEGHEHRLILCSNESNYEKCSSCDSEGKIFRCAHCEFTLNFMCATLPRTIKYEPHEQSFALCYKGEDDFDDEYYCDICEEQRDPKHWFYYCRDLDFPAHPNCILGKYPLLKFGKTYMFDTHEHPLTFVDKSKSVHPPCNKCGDSFYDWSFECVKCKFNLHTWCLRRLAIESLKPVSNVISG